MSKYYKPFVFLLSTWPLCIIIYQIIYNKLGAEPVDKIINHFDNVQDLNLTVKRTKFENINSTLKNNNIYQFINEDDELLMQANKSILGNLE